MKATQRVPALQSGQLDHLAAGGVLAIVFSCFGVSPKRKIRSQQTRDPGNVGLTFVPVAIIVAVGSSCAAWHVSACAGRSWFGRARGADGRHRRPTRAREPQAAGLPHSAW